MEMPEITRCLGVFPPRYGSFLISVFGLGTGGIGLAAIVLFGLVEDSVVAHFVKSQTTDPSVKKAVLASIGLSSLLLVIGNALLILGVICSSPGSVGAAKLIIFTLCMIILLSAMGAPVFCFFEPNACFVKKLSMPILVLVYIVVMIYVQLWLYFVVVIHNFEEQLV